MKILRAALIAGAAFIGSVAAAGAAELATYYHVGAWDAFSGRNDDGSLVCGVGNTNPADGRRFMMRFTIGGTDLTFTARKPSWNIPDNTRTPVVVQVGLGTPLTEQATGSGQALNWTMDRGSAQGFDAQFRRASSMTLTFPDGNEPPWTVPLNGSTAISNAFGRCITDLTARAQASGALPAPTPAPQGPTQPFSSGPGAPPPPAGADGSSQPTAPR